MKMRSFLRVSLAVFFVFSISVGISFGKQPDDKPLVKPLAKEDIFDELELFADAVTLVNTNYVKDVKSKEMIYGALEGMLSSLDSHSSFLTPEELKEIQTETRGEFGGLGIKVTLRDKVLTVVSPLEDTPACKAGILPGDKIVEIDGKSTKDFTLDDAVKKLRGAPGTEVKLTVLREGEDRLRSFVIRRAIIKLKSVKQALVLKGRIGYIRIVEFQQHTPTDLNRAVRRLRNKHIKGLMLDLRNNPGGLLSASISVSEKFLKKGDAIVSTKGRIEQQNMDFKSRAFRPYIDIPMVVLVNKGSASASEIVAGALRDNKRALILGETTFGKGSVQTVIPMKDRSALRLTTSYYYTPSGGIIHEKGIVPDVKVEIAKAEVKEEEEKAEPEAKKEKVKKKSEKELLLERLKEDNQVQAAIELLKDSQRYAALMEN